MSYIEIKRKIVYQTKAFSSVVNQTFEGFFGTPSINILTIQQKVIFMLPQTRVIVLDYTVKIN